MSSHAPVPALSCAPARLDVMGGVSDYAGGLCLEWPLQNAIICRLTPDESARVVARIGSAEEAVALALAELNALDENALRQRFFGAPTGALYVVGAMVILRAEIGFAPTQGFVLEIESDVPQGLGVAAWAALAVATLSALNRAFALELDGHRIALLAQQIATRVVGTPRGVKEVLASSLGRKSHLLRLRCQPDLVEGYVAPPTGIEFWGLGSGVVHSRDAYDVARCATEMGATLLSALVPAAMRGPDGKIYPANLNTDVWRALRPQIPDALSGADFLRHHSLIDTETEVEPQRVYRVRLAVEHPIYEADRAARFAQLLETMTENPAARESLGRAAGELMVQSHFSYAHRCDLGSAETDLLVDLAREAGAKNGIYGAKITGHGAGGTVAFLCDRQRNPDLEGTMETIRARYFERTGVQSQIFSGSSDGANVGSQS